MSDLYSSGGRPGAQAYIISGPSGEGCLAAAGALAAAAVCQGRGEVPCGLCRACRKAEGGIHPDIIRISRPLDDKGRPKREIGVEQIRLLSADAVVLPNEAERKVYIIQDADCMNIPAQNAALKLLEEPPASALFILCAENPEKLLPTVRSRCVHMKLKGEQLQEKSEAHDLAEGFIKAAAKGDRAELCRWCFKNEGLDGRAAGDFILRGQELLADMLCGRRPLGPMGREQALRLAELLERCAGALRVNVGVKHIFGLLAVDAIAGGGKQRTDN